MSEPEARQAFLDWVERDGQCDVARSCGVNSGYLSRMVHGKRPICEAVWSAMGLRRVVSFEPIA